MPWLRDASNVGKNTLACSHEHGPMYGWVDRAIFFAAKTRISFWSTQDVVLCFRASRITTCTGMSVVVESKRQCNSTAVVSNPTVGKGPKHFCLLLGLRDCRRQVSRGRAQTPASTVYRGTHATPACSHLANGTRWQLTEAKRVGENNVAELCGYSPSSCASPV